MGGRPLHERVLRTRRARFGGALPDGLWHGDETLGVERVGLFDDRMLNYYDDVDYGVRLWPRRVSGRRRSRRLDRSPLWRRRYQLEGEAAAVRATRMRVVLKHAPARTVMRWAAHELRTLARADSSRRALKLKAMA